MKEKKNTKNQRRKTKTRENITKKTSNTESNELKIRKKSNDNDLTETSNRGTREN